MPALWSALTSLQYLELGVAGISGTLPPSWSALTNLQYMSVGVNVSGTLPPWPRTFSTVMSRINIININFLQLPKTSCLYPNTPYYSTFQGYTLGTSGALALVGIVWLLGKRLLAPLTLRHASAAERALRLRRFQTVCLSRALLLLYLVYPGVSGVVIAMFNCRTLPSGRAVLVADHRETCWTAQHWRYVAAGIFWALAVPIGIPAAFLGLLYYFRVPRLARAKVADAWLRECVEHAWRLGVPQPPCDVRELSFHSLSDEHLELLVAALVQGKPPAAWSDEGAHNAARVSEPLLAPPRRRRVLRKCCAGGGDADGGLPRPGARRVALEKRLLRWCERSGTLSLPPLAWAEAEDDAPAAPDAHSPAGEEAPSARRLRGAFRGFSTAALTAAPPAELAALEQRALRKVGFLFEAYTVQCWAWESVELGRKLLLTSLLALVAPGSATQVTVGTLIAFGTLLLFQRYRPYAAPGLNFVASAAQVNLVFVLFVGLLLKVRLNERRRHRRQHAVQRRRHAALRRARGAARGAQGHRLRRRARRRRHRRRVGRRRRRRGRRRRRRRLRLRCCDAAKRPIPRHEFHSEERGLEQAAWWPPPRVNRTHDGCTAPSATAATAASNGPARHAASSRGHAWRGAARQRRRRAGRGLC